MTPDTVKAAWKASPFVPFRLHMGGGRSLDVNHPDFFSMSPGGRIATVYGEKDQAEIIEVFMVQSIEFLPDRIGGQRRRKAG